VQHLHTNSHVIKEVICCDFEKKTGQDTGQPISATVRKPDRRTSHEHTLTAQPTRLQARPAACNSFTALSKSLATAISTDWAPRISNAIITTIVKTMLQLYLLPKCWNLVDSRQKQGRNPLTTLTDLHPLCSAAMLLPIGDRRLVGCRPAGLISIFRWRLWVKWALLRDRPRP